MISSGSSDFEPLYIKIQQETFFLENLRTDVLNESNQPVWPPVDPVSFDEFGYLI